MKTNFCHNGRVVTSHSTKMSHGVFAPGWSYAPGPTRINCFDRKAEWEYYTGG